MGVSESGLQHRRDEVSSCSESGFLYRLMSGSCDGNRPEVVALNAFAPMPGPLADVPDRGRGQGQLYTLPHVLLFPILGAVTGCNSADGIAPCRRKHGAISSQPGLQLVTMDVDEGGGAGSSKGLDAADVEVVFRAHAAQLRAARAAPGIRIQKEIRTTASATPRPVAQLVSGPAMVISCVNVACMPRYSEPLLVAATAPCPVRTRTPNAPRQVTCTRANRESGASGRELRRRLAMVRHAPIANVDRPRPVVSAFEQSRSAHVHPAIPI